MSFSSQFIEVLDALCDKIGIAIDWTSQNVMPYVTDLATRIITYEISTSAAWIIICLLMKILKKWLKTGVLTIFLRAEQCSI